MRWCAPLVIVAIVAAGASRPIHAATEANPSSMLDDRAPQRVRASASAELCLRPSQSSTLVSRRGLAGRGAVFGRFDRDEGMIVPDGVLLVEVPVIAIVMFPFTLARRFTPARIEVVARGPPIL